VGGGSWPESKLETRRGVFREGVDISSMATEESYQQAGRPGERAPEGYVSPTVDFLAIFALSVGIAALTASVLVL
jgi:hypothetical protein